MHRHSPSRIAARLLAACIVTAAPAVPGLDAVAQMTETQTSPEASLLEKGKYLATAGDCISCHTRPGGEPFSGGLPFETDFGTLFSANITPDRETGIGEWSEDQLARAMRRGIGADGRHLYPAFPYTAFTKVSDADIQAIFAYLRSLKPVRYNPPKNAMAFPFSVRATMIGWNALFLKDGRYAPDTTRSAEWNRGAYLVQGLGHCGACHTPRNRLGGERDSLALTGAVYQDDIADSVQDQENVPLKNVVRPWAAVNLTPSPRGLAAWSIDDIAAYLKTGHNARAGAFGPMAKVVGKSTRYLSDPDLHAIAVYLKSLPPAARTIEKTVTPAQMKAGEIAFTIRCGQCHLPTGLGSPKTPDADPTKISPPLVGNTIVLAENPASLINVILYGAHETAPDAEAWPKMPGFELDFGLGMNDEQIAAIANYVRNSWGNSAGAVDPRDVARQRYLGDR